MAYTLMRTAHSTFVKETEDFSCGLLTREGVTFASPKGLGATWYIGLDYGPVVRMIDSYEDGDICITDEMDKPFVSRRAIFRLRGRPRGEERGVGWKLRQAA